MKRFSTSPGRDTHSAATQPDRSAAAPAAAAMSRRFRNVLAIIPLLLSGVLPAAASPSGALRDYKAGQYDQALKEYERLLQRKADDPRLHFNAGAAAYRNRQFEEAAKQFNSALAAQDLKLQELAYYNRGNSLYWLGEQNPDYSKKTESWEKSLKDFESSLKLNPQDADAKNNHEFVKRRLEELKQQQQQQNQSKQDKSDKNQKQDQNQQQQQQSKQDQNQQQQQQSKQDQSQQKQDTSQQQQQQQQQQKPAEEKEQQTANQSQEQKDKEQQPAQASGQKQDKSDEKEQKDAMAYAAGQMTPEQAEQLLDAQKDEEQVLQLKPEAKPQDRNRPFKDW